MLAYKLKCKGITVYRDKSKREQVIERKVENIEELLKKREREIMQLKLFPEEYVKLGSTESTACREGICE
jgi:ribonucleoside-diphosphate reductase alpha chain